MTPQSRRYGSHADHRRSLLPHETVPAPVVLAIGPAVVPWLVITALAAILIIGVFSL